MTSSPARLQRWMIEREKVLPDVRSCWPVGFSIFLLRSNEKLFSGFAVLMRSRRTMTHTANMISEPSILQVSGCIGNLITTTRTRSEDLQTRVIRSWLTASWPSSWPRNTKPKPLCGVSVSPPFLFILWPVITGSNILKSSEKSKVLPLPCTLFEGFFDSHITFHILYIMFLQ